MGTQDYPSMGVVMKMQQEEEEEKELTFHPKINTNIKVPADRSIMNKPSYSARYNQQKLIARKGSAGSPKRPKQTGMFKTYSSQAVAAKANPMAKSQRTGKVGLKFNSDRPQTSK